MKVRSRKEAEQKKWKEYCIKKLSNNFKKSALKEKKKKQQCEGESVKKIKSFNLIKLI